MTSALRLGLCLFLAALLSGGLSARAGEPTKPTLRTFDFLAAIRAQPDHGAGIGLPKLSEGEQKGLNELLLSVYSLGTSDALKLTIDPDEQRGVVPAYKTKIESDDDDVLKLENGAIVEVSGFLGFVGFRKDAVLFRNEASWKIWIEGKKVLSCTVLRQPQGARRTDARLVTVVDMKADGELLKMASGSLYEVLDSVDTALWLAPFDALLLDGNELLNLEEGDDPVDIVKLK